MEYEDMEGWEIAAEEHGRMINRLIKALTAKGWPAAEILDLIKAITADDVEGD